MSENKKMNNDDKLRAPRGITVIFKGLDRCNAGCIFCSVGETEGSIISREDFSLLVQRLGAFIESRKIDMLNFTFHGGEPTLYDPAFLDWMCGQILPIAPEVHFQMQSNLLSVSDDFLDIVIKHGIQFGTSIDPICGERRDKAGSDAFPQWFRTYCRVSERIKGPGAIFVVTKKSADKAAELYAICEAIGSQTASRFPLQINPVYPQGKVSGSGSGALITPAEFGAFLIDIWQVWEESGRSISLVPVEQFAAYFSGGRKNAERGLACSMRGNCADSHVGIDYRLNVAGCGRRLDSRSFFGNLKNSPLDEILKTSEEKAQIRDRRRILDSRECGTCEYRILCGGGCPDDAWLVTGDIQNKSQWCESYKMLFAAMREYYGHNKGASLRHRGGEPVRKQRIHIYDDGFAPESAAPGDQIWLLPDKGGRYLQYDSPLSDCLSLKKVPIVLWCCNSQVKSLVLWEDLVRNPSVRVALFESEGIERAMNTLNALGAAIELDLTQILACEGGESALDSIVTRFISDPLWKSQIYPFSGLLMRYLQNSPAKLQDDLGFLPGYGLPADAQKKNDDAHAGRIIGNINRNAEVDLAQWIAGRKECLLCGHFRICGSRFAKGDGRMCNEKIRSLITQLKQTASKMAEDLNAAAGKEG